MNKQQFVSAHMLSKLSFASQLRGLTRSSTAGKKKCCSKPGLQRCSIVDTESDAAPQIPNKRASITMTTPQIMEGQELKEEPSQDFSLMVKDEAGVEGETASSESRRPMGAVGDSFANYKDGHKFDESVEDFSDDEDEESDDDFEQFDDLADALVSDPSSRTLKVLE